MISTHSWRERLQIILTFDRLLSNLREWAATTGEIQRVFINGAGGCNLPFKPLGSSQVMQHKNISKDFQNYFKHPWFTGVQAFPLSRWFILEQKSIRFNNKAYYLISLNIFLSCVFRSFDFQQIVSLHFHGKNVYFSKKFRPQRKTCRENKV